MKILVVFAHPKRDSLTGTVLQEFVRGARESQHDIEVIDLYAEDYDPRFSQEDFELWRDGSPAREHNQRYQRMIDACDALVFIYPIWWWSVPAILKGWFDQVFNVPWMATWEITYDPHERYVPVIIPVLKGKKILQLCAGGSSMVTYQKYGYAGALQRQIDAGIFFYSGATDVETHIMADIDDEADAREKLITLAYERGRDIRPGNAYHNLSF